MQKIIKNTIEDFTDDQEIIEIEKLILDKKYDEALKKIKIYGDEKLDKFALLNPQQQIEERYKAYIINILNIICMQYTNLSDAIYALIIIGGEDNYQCLGLLVLFNDILQKIKSGYYGEQHTKTANKWIAKTETTLEYLINEVGSLIHEILPTNKEEILNYKPQKNNLDTEKVIAYALEKTCGKCLVCVKLVATVYVLEKFQNAPSFEPSILHPTQ